MLLSKKKCIYIFAYFSKNYFLNNSTADCSHAFSYVLEPNHSSPVTLLVNLHKIHRVAAGLENGRLFLLDSTLIPASSKFGEGSFVLTELGTGNKLYSSCVVWNNEE